MPTERVRSKRFLLPEIIESLVAELVDASTFPPVRILSDDGSQTGIIPRRVLVPAKTPEPSIASAEIEYKEFSEVVRCGDSARIVRWVA